MEGLRDGEVVRSELAAVLGDGGGDGRGRDRVARLGAGRFFDASVGAWDGTLTHDSLILPTEVDDDVAKVPTSRKPSVEGRHTTSLQQVVSS